MFGLPLDRIKGAQWESEAVGILLILIVDACGGSAATTTEAPTTTIPTTTTSTVSVNTRYESVFDMRELVEASGFECTTWTIRGTSDYAVESADCTDQIVFAIHENASQAQEQIEVRKALMGNCGRQQRDPARPELECELRRA